MSTHPGGRVKEFRPGVAVGRVAGYGIAIIIDDDEAVNLYSPPNVVDPSLPSISPGEGIVLIAEKCDSFSIGKDIPIKKRFVAGFFELVENDEDLRLAFQM